MLALHSEIGRGFLVILVTPQKLVAFREENAFGRTQFLRLRRLVQVCGALKTVAALPNLLQLQLLSKRLLAA